MSASALVSQTILENSYKYGLSPLNEQTFTSDKKTYLFGHPIAHSLSPLLQNTIYKTLGLPLTYTLHESLDRDGYFPLLKSDTCIGSGVTMPHKVTMMPYVDDVTPEGRKVGAINTIFVRLDPTTKERRYIGTNTDIIGITASFLINTPEIAAAARGKPAMVIGGGGACRSAIYALAVNLGASKIYLNNRLETEADTIIADMIRVNLGTEIIYVETVEMAETLESPALIVGTIPNFPPKAPEEIQARAVTKHFVERKEKGAILEMCYHPIITELYQLFEDGGWKVIPGSEAMIYQGVAQAILWLERGVGGLEKTGDDAKFLEGVENAKKAVTEKVVEQEALRAKAKAEAGK